MVDTSVVVNNTGTKDFICTYKKRGKSLMQVFDLINHALGSFHLDPTLKALTQIWPS